MKNYRVLIAILVGTAFSTIANIILFNVIGDIVKSSPTSISFRGTWGGYIIFTIVGIVVGFPTGLIISGLTGLLRLNVILSILLGLFFNFCLTTPLLLPTTTEKFDDSTMASIYPFIIIGGITGAIVSFLNPMTKNDEDV
jgi:hypothetical protein